MSENESVSGIGPREEVERLKAERDFLLSRADQAGRIRFTGDRQTGVSANAMVRFAIAGEAPSESQFPMDPDDLAACWRTIKSAPDHLRGGMRPLFIKYRKAVAERYPEVMDEDWQPGSVGRDGGGISLSKFIERIDDFVDDGPSKERSGPAR